MTSPSRSCKAMIEAHGLVKCYGSTIAVNDLSFSIRPGPVTGFLGPNGAGKTTTMRMILGLDAPTQPSTRSGSSRRWPTRWPPKAAAAATAGTSTSPPQHQSGEPHDHPQRTQLLATALAYPATSSRRRTPPASRPPSGPPRARTPGSRPMTPNPGQPAPADQPIGDAAARDQVRQLHDQGATYRAIARTAGTGAMTIHDLATHRRPPLPATITAVLRISPASVPQASYRRQESLCSVGYRDPQVPDRRADRRQVGQVACQ
jgi:energy-coupling factor transporter ATP-binding protein EcfA2